MIRPSLPSRWGGVCYSYLALAMVLGGASARAELSNLILQLFGVLLGFLAVGRLRRENLQGPTKFALLIIGAIILLPLAQLVPLPSGIWAALPGRGTLLRDAGLLGGVGWSPLSLYPIGTLDALCFLIPPIALFLAFLSSQAEDRRQLPVAIILLAASSMLIGLMQSAGAEALWIHGRYSTTSEPLGFFPNRNHQGLLMALAVAAAGLGQLPSSTGNVQRAIWLTIMLAFVLFALMTGSRAALGLAAIAFGASCLIAFFRSDLGRKQLLALGGGAAVLAVSLAAIIALSPQFDRFWEKTAELESDQRFHTLEPTAAIAAKFFPTGTGLGSFAPVFGWQAPELSEGAQFFNHAHNDYLELAMTGGLPAILVLLAFCIWLFGRVREGAGGGPQAAQLRNVIYAVIALLLAHSLVDYPLRTGALSGLLAVCCALLLPSPYQANSARKRAERPTPSSAAPDSFNISSIGAVNPKDADY